MPDITMCEGEGWDTSKGVNASWECPWKDGCHRHTATPTEYRQSWFLNMPGKFDRDGKFDCDNYQNNGRPIPSVSANGTDDASGNDDETK